MNKLETLLKRISTGLVIFVQVATISVVQVPRAAFAQEAPATCPTVNGTVAPTGASAHTFTFRPADGPAPTCVWENAYYTWSPSTKVYTPKFETRECDSATGICENISWDYVTSDAKYVERRTVVYVPPTPVESPAAQESNLQQPTDSTTPTATRTGNGTTANQSGTSITSGNGANSTNTAANNSSNNVNGSLNNNVNVLTTLDSNATTGNASALFNTTVGDVGTGDAATIANILNMIQSSWDPTQGDINLFTADLFANYYGDIMFDPSIVLGNGTDSNNTVANNANNNLAITVSNDANIQNDINLNATSGNSTANGNTTVGDVSTGDANAVANVINMINSMITAGNSFIGSINLHGDLNGDILLPQSIMEILLGNGTDSSNSISNNSTLNADIDTSTNSAITNNTDLSANSGNAEANRNTSVGNISTGDSETNVNEMNLIGQNVQARGGLLVFVNVLGSWMGMLFNGPGTTAITAGNGTNSSNTIANNTNTNADIDVENNYGITNNLNLNARSGDATANANTDVGNVSTGDATASANILNMINSNMNFTDWFGVLFINVFGNWQGSFGTDTANGERPTGGMGAGPVAEPTPTASRSSDNISRTDSSPSSVNNIRSGSTGAFARVAGIIAGNTNSDDNDEEGVLSTSIENTPPAATEDATDTESNTDTELPAVSANAARNNSTVWWVTGIAGLASLLLLGGDRLLLLLRKP